MDLWKGYELSRTYVPAAYYTITSIKSKNGRANPLHDEVLGRKASIGDYSRTGNQYPDVVLR